MIRVCEPWLPGNEAKYVADSLEKTNISGSFGRYIEGFEDSFAKFCDVKNGVACSNGLGALHLACAAIGLKEGDEVIVPAFTMVATINAIIYTGAKPVLTDIDSETYCINPREIESKITPNTKAIIPVHIYGHPCDMDLINEIARKHNLFVIEDAAEAHGAEYRGKKVGGLGHIGCFSFYANKIITTGEGGMCVTNDDSLAEKMRVLRDHGFGVPRFTHQVVGFNYRMSNIHAAIGFAQVENAEKLVEARRKIGLEYNKRLEDLKDYLVLPVEKDYAKNVYWMYAVKLKEKSGLTKDEVMKKLKDMGVDTRGFFIPMNKQPAYLNGEIKNAPDCTGEYPVSEEAGSKGFYLPSSSNLTEKEMDFVCNCLRNVLLNGNASSEKVS